MILFSLQKFIKDPYTTTFGSFSRVTNFLRDVLLQPGAGENAELKFEEILEEDDIPGMEVSTKDEPGFEFVTKVGHAPNKDLHIQNFDNYCIRNVSSPVGPSAWMVSQIPLGLGHKIFSPVLLQIVI